VKAYSKCRTAIEPNSSAANKAKALPTCRSERVAVVMAETAPRPVASLDDLDDQVTACGENRDADQHRDEKCRHVQSSDSLLFVFGKTTSPGAGSETAATIF
jgi:transposase